MMVLRRSLLPAGLLAAAIVAFLGIFALTASAEAGVTETPRGDTLQVIDGEVLDSVVIGNRIVVVGTFTQVRNPGGNAITQPHIAAYNADTGQFDGSFRPNVDEYINSVAEGPGGSIIIGGQFNTVEGEAHRRLAKLNSNGSVASAFQTTVGSTVNVVEVANGKVYFGGRFTTVNGEPRTSLAAVDVNTGAVDAVTDFDFSFSNQAGGGVAVRWLDISEDGSFMFVAHGARFIDDEVRSGIARFDLSANSTTLNNWRTLLYDNELDRLGGVVRARRIAIAPDSSYVVMVTSGGDRPPAADTAVRFPSTGGANVQADWVSRHFDTVLGVDINDDVVFVGGHFQFQEAPGSDDPFPGDPLTNFGFGQNQGPLSLGSQVVQREQIGALDPATGKSLDWNPGSDSFLGVQSLTWDDEYGLLVGHDGARLGGVNNIGRHGVFPIDNTPPPPPPAGDDLSCDVAFNGDNATVTFDGDLGLTLQLRVNDDWAATLTGDSATIEASDGDTITARVRGPNYADPFQDFDCPTDDTPPPPGNADFVCEVSFNGGSADLTFDGDLGNTLQVRRNGDWAATVTGDSVTINADEADTITARVRGPNYADPFQDFDCPTNDAPPPGGVDEIATQINSPSTGAVVDGGTVTISGESEAPGGISRVRLTVVRAATGEYLNADGTYTAEWAPLDIDLNTDAETSTWSIDVELNFVGEFDVTARTFDAAGNRDDSVRRNFTVGGVAGDPPELIVNAPTITGNEVVLNGVATDDVSVSSVTFQIQNRDTLEYFRNDGTLGAAQGFTTTLSNPGGTFTEWTRTITGLPVGEWRITADAFDGTGQRDRAGRSFSQVGNFAPPEITVTAGEDQKLPANSAFTFSGSAVAEAGIENIQVLLRDVVTFAGVGQNGELVRQSVFFVVPGTNGGTSTNWTYTSPQLEVGTYEVRLRVLDEFGAVDTVTTEVIVGPAGDDLPTTTFDGTNRFAQGVDSLTVDISGTAADDIGVSQVTIGVFDRQVGQWLQPDGTYQRYPEPFLADLSSPGGTSTDWALSFTAPTAGEYQFFVRAVDTAGQADSDRQFGSLRAYPGDTVPTLLVLQPGDDEVITTNRISVAGSAEDDTVVAEVEVRIRDEATGNYLRSDGTFGTSEWQQASLTNIGGDRTNWNYSSPVIPDGEYRIQVRSIDDNNQTSSIETRIVTLE